MRIARISAVAAAAVCLASAPAFAGGQKGKSGHAPAPHGNAHAQAPKTAGTHGNPHTTASAPKPVTHGNPHTTTGGTTTPTTGSRGSSHAAKETTTTKAHGNPNATTTPTADDGGTTRTPRATATTVTLNPIAQKLQGKPLGARIEKMLPANMTLNTASDGFRNQGQFIAAVHVSQNLGIPFADLKAAMLGTPVQGDTTAATSPKSLGQAIQQLRPFANSTTEVSRAESAAERDLGTIGATSTTAPRPITSAKTKKRGK